MRVRLDSVGVTPEWLDALAHHYGLDRRATREDVRAWANTLLEAAADDVRFDYEQELARRGEQPPRNTCPDCGQLLSYDPAYTPPDHPRVLAHASICEGATR
jgi:hypothetical protein